MTLNSETILFAVFGDPVSHSLGPVMHNTALSDVGYNGAYLAFRVKDIGKAVTGIKALGIKGVSITIPHKVSVMDFLDELDETAQKIGAVNTIVNIDAMPVRKQDLDKIMVVMDIVCNPLKTRFLREAESIGCRTIDGVSMFVYQGTFQFELWTGMKAPIEVMRKAVFNALLNL